jgi:hypothetical protein
MSAAAVLRDAAECGVSLSLNGANVAFKAAVRPPPALLARLREHKAEIVALLRREIATEPPAAHVSDGARASVDRLIADMAAENDRRRGWHKQPLDDWRAGYIKIRSALTGETTIIRFHNRGRA